MGFIKKLKRTIPAILTILLCLAFSTPAASAFDGNDYDGGWDDGGWDDGGWDDGGWDDGGWDGDDDWGSDDWDGDDDWGSGSGSGGGSSYDIDEYGVGVVIGGMIILFSPIIIVIIIVLRIRKKKGIGQPGAVRRSSDEGMGVFLPDRTVQIESIIKAHDPNFSAGDFTSFVKRMYIDIQLAWCNRDMTPVRALLHDNLYDATTRQVNEKISQGVVYHYEGIAVTAAYLTSYAKDAQFEYLTVYLNAGMVDWQEDEKTGNILRGDKTTRWNLRYKMKFMRSTGVQTKEENTVPSSVDCPNCGAPLDMASSTKCTYCDAVVTTGQYSWVLSDFGTVRNDTVDEGIRSE